MAAVCALALGAAHVLLELKLDALGAFATVLDQCAAWHDVLLHSLKQCQHSLRLAHAGHSHDLVLIVDVVGQELALLHLTANDNLAVADRIVADELQRLVVVAGPEEGDTAVWDELAHHVEGGVGALLKCNNPVLDTAA